jgi:predicted O-methyltransferase YrrM
MFDPEITLMQVYENRKKSPIATDICDHMDTLLKYGRECQTIAEFGTRWGTSTLCWILSGAKKIRCYDIAPQRLSEWESIKRYIKDKRIDFHLARADTRITDIEPCDLLFIDTEHTYDCLSRELDRNGNKAQKYLVFHDTTYSPECYQAVVDFCKYNPHWRIREHWANNNGLTVCERVSDPFNYDNTPEGITIQAVARGAGQNRSELKRLIEYVISEKPKTIVEIGTDKGGTFWAFCQVIAKDGMIVSVDLPNQHFSSRDVDEFKRNEFMKSWHPGAVPIVGNSHDPNTLKSLRSVLKGRKIDLLMIDGDHSYSGVKKDCEMYVPLVREGGSVVFHDVVDSEYHRLNNVEVYRFWKELTGNKVEIDGGYHWGGIGILKHTTEYWPSIRRVENNLPGVSDPDSVTPTVSVGNGQESAR